VIGANYTGDNKCVFSVWDPLKKSMVLHLLDPSERKLEMKKSEEGYFKLELDNVPPGSRYFFMPDKEKDYPDPVSHFQPEGVHGPSAVIDHDNYIWQDEQWRGLPFQDLILYELHIGTFTPEGTFEAAIGRLDDLVETGINAIEIMPVAQFPGNRNWGYDGAYPYAVQNSYGGPGKLKELVDACHQKGIAVILDVVYNHMGPEGNYFTAFGPYFTDRYHTPWGDAMNFDWEWSDGVREFFIENALYWLEKYHIDGLRLDAIHAIFDQGAVHILELINEKVKELQQKLGRSLHVIAESDLNSPHVIKAAEAGGLGFTAQWLDDFHHSLYVLLDEKGKERYEDFGRMEQVAKAYMDGFVHSGEYVNFRKRKFGASSAGLPGNRFVIFMDNHDQAGNRLHGERLSMLIDQDRRKIAAAAMLLAPYVPMLFMGEEYGEDSPFFYFVDHSDPELIKGVREGRKKEFACFNGPDAEPRDAFEEKTFLDSKLRWEKRNEGEHRELLKWYQQLISLRCSHPAGKNFKRCDVRVDITGERSLILHRQDDTGKEHLVCFFNLSDKQSVSFVPAGLTGWIKIMDSKNTTSHDLSAQNISLEPYSVIICKAKRSG
jgi:maltooligosyltrehalose trehalohydrolase